MSLEQSSNYEEKRDSIRAKRIVTVRHRLAKHKGKKVAVGDWQVAMTENMSYSGLLFASATEYQPGDWVEVEVVMSGFLDIFKGYGEVVRQKKHKNGFYYIAIKYVDLKSKETKKAETKVKKASKK